MSILSKIKYEIIKTAAEAGFNEAPDTAAASDVAPAQAQQAPAPAQAPVPVDPNANMAAVPADGEVYEEPMYQPSPEEFGIDMAVSAASKFISEAAASGAINPETERLISETAGSIAGKVIEAMMRRAEAMMDTQHGYAEAPDQAGMYAEPPAQQATPQQQPMAGGEEVIANNIAPIN